MNKVVLIGNLTRDPELRQTPSGVSVCQFGIAVNRRFADQNGQRGVDFFNIVVWRAQGENCAKYLAKGKPVAVIGHLETRQYEDKQGVKHNIVEVIAEEVQFLGSGNKGEGGATSSRPDSIDDMSGFSEMDAQLPF